jgi:hypothetical protein
MRWSKARSSGLMNFEIPFSMVSFLPMCGIKQTLFSLASYAVIMWLSVLESSPIGPVRIEVVTQAGYPSNPPSTLKIVRNNGRDERASTPPSASAGDYRQYSHVFTGS